MSVAIDKESHAQRLMRFAFASALGVLLCSASATTAALAANASSNQSTSAVTTCAAQQTITIDPRIGWRCEMAMAPQQAYLIRVDQRNADVTVAVIDPENQEMLAVDSPTKRAGPELALVRPQLAGKHVVAIRFVDPESAPKPAAARIERLVAAPDGPLIAGLAQLTQATVSAGKEKAASPEQSILGLQEAAMQLRSAAAIDYEAEAMLRVACVYFWQVDDSRKAALAAGDAMTLFAAIPDPAARSQAATIRAASLVEIANAMKQPGRRVSASPGQSQFAEAMQLLTEAAQTFQTAGMQYDQAQAINYQGVGLFYQGQFDDAKAKYRQAAQLFTAQGNQTAAALPLQNIAHIDSDSGDYAQAIDSYKSVLALLSPSENAGQYVTVLINLGRAQYGIGEFDGALRSLIKALQICEDRGFAAEQARSLHSLGMVYLVIGERERAEIFLERALVLRRSLASQSPRDLQTSLIRVGDLRRERGDVHGALKLHIEALDSALSPSQKVRALYAIGRDHEANEALPAAMQAYESASQLGLSEDSPVQALVTGAHGRVRLNSGDESGRALILKTAQLHENHGNLDFAAQDYLALATADRNRGRLEQALHNLGKALAFYESQRLRATNPDLRATYLASRGAAFELQGDLYMALWERASSSREKKRLSDLALLANEANRRQVLDDFRGLAGGTAAAQSGRTAALDQQLSAKRHRLAVLMEQQNPPSEAVEGLQSDISLLRTQLDLGRAKPTAAASGSEDPDLMPTTAEEIQATLAPDEVLLAYQPGEHRSWLWSITREATAALQLRGRAEIEDAARALYVAWSTPGGLETDMVRELGASRIILGAAADSVRGKRTLTVVAEGMLRNLPFGALLMEARPGAAPARLASTHAVRFRWTLSGDARNVRREASRDALGNRILLVGDPTVPDAVSRAQAGAAGDPWAWQPLPGTRREIGAIAEIAGDWRSYVLLGAEATKPALLSMPLDTFRAIHFATHARLDVQDPQLSSIALSSRDANFAAASSTLTVREILAFRLRAETVVLSACEASLGKRYRGQLSFGLSEAFLLAGARNVLGSLWRVSDAATEEYMRHFYEQYIRHDASPAASAQAAARAMSENPEFAQPFFWAAFVVTQR